MQVASEIDACLSCLLGLGNEDEEKRGTALLDPLVVHVSDGTSNVYNDNWTGSLDIPCFRKGSGFSNS